MQEILAQITGIARGMWRFRWAGVLVAWLVAAVATVVVFRIPNQYEASARIYVDTQSILKPLMAGLAVQPNIEQQIGMLSRTLISRPNLEKLVRMADLDLGAQSKTQQDKLFDDLTKDIRINSTTRDNLFTLNYKNSDQDKAKRVIQSLVSIFVESSLGARFGIESMMQLAAVFRGKWEEREGWGWHDPARWTAFFDATDALGQTTKPIDVSNVIDNSFVAPANTFDQAKVEADAAGFALSEDMAAVDVELIKAQFYANAVNI